ncbi:ArnT family glycosyltransferase [Muriicola sp. E247]|uniref:ArnT family glycosyltransferase n=1 Tax=Muriicola sp. E247 TaxID=3242730 RepID=UPI00352467F8
MISSARYWSLFVLILLVYVAGLFVTLFENDSAQFAVMAMRMVQENDFLSLFKGPEEYLDKPHMHYWLAALAYKVFGIHDWAYRIPALLATLLGAYSTMGLGSLLYNKQVGKVAGLIFLTAQTIVLSNIDVRTDAVLTGFTIFAIWQLAKYIKDASLPALLLGAFAAGIAFSTKGQIALLVIGIPVFFHLAYSGEWKRLFHWKVLLALLIFALTISPMLYAYYQQFDLHPEKVIRGKTNRSGILFIFWEQSFERLSGEGVGKNSSDYFFFFHTFLWVFLPWTLIGLIAYYSQLKKLIKTHFRRNPKFELLTVGGIGVIFIIISFAQFKLPHYLNILIPLFSILAASYLFALKRKQNTRALNIVLGLQYFVLSLVFIATALICFYVFEWATWLAYVPLFIAYAVVAYFIVKKEAPYLRIITISILASVLLNGVLNLHFYPELLKYQGGSNMAEIVEEKDIPVDRIHKISTRHTWALDFYNQNPVNISSLEEIKQLQDIWIYANEEELTRLDEEGIYWDMEYEVDQFRITRLQGKFLNPETRPGILNKMYLLHKP